MGETGFEAIIIAPAYRLNVFGFIASKELLDEAAESGEAAGNLGFWDQRMALEWTARNIGYFGGNAGNITVGGKKTFNDMSVMATAKYLFSATRILSRLSQHVPSTCP